MPSTSFPSPLRCSSSASPSTSRSSSACATALSATRSTTSWKRSGALRAASAATTAVGFLSVVPTAYTGVSDLGLISGAGMVIALVLNLTVLPALLVIIRPRGERRAVGFHKLRKVDRYLVEHRRAVGLISLAVAVGGLALVPRLTFDFNPLNLKDPRTESVSTLFDLMKDPDTTPNTIAV